MRFEKINCNLCQSRNHSILFYSYDYNFGLPGKFTIVKCNHCQLVFQNPRPILINHFYPPSYPAHQNNLSRSVVIDQAICAKKIGKILDIGCGTGNSLLPYLRIGWQCFGVEISRAASEIAIQKGLQVQNNDFSDSQYPKQYFDVVNLNHSLEHFQNPLLVLKKISKIIKEDGLLRIAIPNFKSFARLIFSSYWFNLDLPRHLYHFTPQTLNRILNLSGFKIQKIKHQSSVAGILGSLQYFFLKQKKPFREWRKNKYLSLIFFPLTFLIDLFHFGDTIIVYAKVDPLRKVKLIKRN